MARGNLYFGGSIPICGKSQRAEEFGIFSSENR